MPEGRGENKLVLSQFTVNKIGISRFTKKKCHFWTQTCVTYLKSYTESTALLDVFTIRLFLRVAKRKPSKTRQDNFIAFLLKVAYYSFDGV